MYISVMGLRYKAHCGKYAYLLNSAYWARAHVGAGSWWCLICKTDKTKPLWKPKSYFCPSLPLIPLLVWDSCSSVELPKWTPCARSTPGETPHSARRARCRSAGRRRHVHCPTKQYPGVDSWCFNNILLSGCIQQLLLEVAKTSCSIEKKCPTNSDGAELNLVEFLGTLFSRPLRSKVGLWGKSCVCVPLIYAIQEVLIAELILHLMSTASCTANSL